MTAASRLAATLAIAFFGVVAPAGAIVPTKTITSAGPLTNITIGNEAGCQVTHSGDTAAELFPSGANPGDCGTFIFAGGTLYAPNMAQHSTSAASGLGTTTAFTPVSQGDVAGAGSQSSPYTITTVYTAGTLKVTELDSYVIGSEVYRTDVTIQNTAGVPAQGIVYRAGDCYLQESDTGYGFVEAANNGPGCAKNPNNTPAGRIEQWVPLTAGSAYMEDSYGTVWRAIGAHAMLPNTCQCTVALDNGAGLSWAFNIPAGQSATYSALTVFSPAGVTGGQQQQPVPTGPATGAGTPPTLNGRSALPLPSARRCTSKRAFPIKIRQYRGITYDFATVAVNGRRVNVLVYTSRRLKVTRIGAVYLNRKRFRAFVDLRGLAKGRYAVRVTAVTRDGQVLTNTRNYRTCSRRLAGGIPKL